jgi:hypothetical protein
MRTKLPPECKIHTHSEPQLTVWQLLEREGLLDHVYTETWLWYTLSPQLRQQRERERDLLQATRIAGYTPPRLKRRTRPDPCLYLTTLRGSHYRLHADGSVQIWKRNPPQLGIGGGGWGWYLAAGHSPRWLWAIRSALLLRSFRVENAADGTTEPEATTELVTTSPPALLGERSPEATVYTQRSLFD